ncbi:hypothetical protein [Comamonas thiooxydans]|uniref:hypothetical protein n=1 Tax=Comamonas thiooxydans TaxID=363952 RepID=UPI00209C006F|nr:hypothetical protein [Comamonas thiooxydans]MCO8250207.1 hypothetical protein [Comamonas thiooxydans]
MIIEILEFLIALGLISVGALLQYWLAPYMKERAKNSALAIDVARLTELTDQVKKNLDRIEKVYDKKYQMKHDACLDALKIVDARISTIFTENNPDESKVDRQYSTIEETRHTHNRLVLSVDNPEILRLFMNILCNIGNPIENLAEMRNLIRTELNFSGMIEIDKEKTWIRETLDSAPK